MHGTLYGKKDTKQDYHHPTNTKYIRYFVIECEKNVAKIPFKFDGIHCNSYIHLEQIHMIKIVIINSKRRETKRKEHIDNNCLMNLFTYKHNG